MASTLAERLLDGKPEPRIITESNYTSPPEGMPDGFLTAKERTGTRATHSRTSWITLWDRNMSLCCAGSSDIKLSLAVTTLRTYISVFILTPNDPVNSSKPRYELHGFYPSCCFCKEKGSLVICDVWMEGHSHTGPAREPLMLRTAVHTLDSDPPGTWETRCHVDLRVSCWSHTSPSQLFSIGAHIVKWRHQQCPLKSAGQAEWTTLPKMPGTW